ncbi:hypothetical protein CHH55_16010 [Niallia circulans]|uniref:hypothetical protein n=1 Tax=Niallia circulans TaxID=1397 RepID=UPI000BA4FCE2|nr:hypothetical protein [Niallia circulans]PAD86963.1 hypothetical protein CHH55_16010 [Niallia circulans]
MINVMKGFFASFFCYLFLYAILFLIENKIDELFEALIFLSLSGFFIILIQTIIMELCFKIEGYNRLFAIMIGFIYGVAISIIFSGTLDTEISVHLWIGFIGSICSFIYAITRNDF